MLEKCKNLRHWLYYFQLGMLTMLFCMGTFAQSLVEVDYSRNPANQRDPANYIIDDDVIVVPVEYDERLRNTLFDFKYDRLQRLKDKVDYWVEREQFFYNWGFEDDEIRFGPTQAQKDDVYKIELIRYFTRVAGDPIQDDLRSWWDSYREENNEQKQSEVIENRNNDVVADIVDKELERRGLVKRGKVSEFEYALKFRPLPLRKMLDFLIESSIADVRIRYSNGGDTEVLVDKRYRKLGLYWLADYNTITTAYEFVVDKNIYGPLSLRLSQIYSPDQSEEEIKQEIDPIERRVSARYSISF